MIDEILKEKGPNPATVAMVLKALLLGHEITTEQGVFKYFKKGDWIELDEDTEGEIAEEGVFRRCEVVQNGQLHSHRWLLWVKCLPDFMHFVEKISPHDLAIVAANLTISEK